MLIAPAAFATMTQKTRDAYLAHRIRDNTRQKSQE